MNVHGSGCVDVDKVECNNFYSQNYATYIARQLLLVHVKLNE